MSKHLTHHQGSPRHDLGVSGYLVLGFAALIGFSMIIQLVVVAIQLVAVIIIILAVTWVAAALIWHYTKFQRMGLKLWLLKWELDGVIRQHTAGKAVAQSLSERDRSLAYQQLDQVRGAGQRCCGQVRALRTELLKAKQSVLTKLGQLPAEKLVAKLAPFTAMEEEIDKVILGFDVATAGKSRKKLKK